MAVIVLALEITARFVVFGVRGLDPRRLPGASILDAINFDTDPAIGFEMKPNLDRFAGLVHLRTNSRGMRDREYDLEKKPGTFRVAVLGSSFSVPAGVEIEDAYHSLLEERLSAEFAPRRYEFLNFSIGAQMPSQFIAILQSRALAFDPDLIIFSLTRMSLPHLFREWNRRAAPEILEVLPSGWRSIFVELVRSRLGLLPRNLGLQPPHYLGGRTPVPNVIQKLGQIHRTTGIPIVVFRIEYDPRPATRTEKSLRRRLRRHGIHYFDSRTAFEGIDPRSMWIHELDPHPNEVAHRIFADALGAFLRDEGLLGH